MSCSLKLCEPCLYIKEEEAATGFCLTCAEYLCRGCTKDHMKAKLTREHSLLQDHIPENAEILRDLRDMTMCKGHAGIKVTHYCKEHDDFLCAVCCLEKHSTCKDVDKLTEEAKNDNPKNVDMQVQLEEIRNSIKECVKRAEEYKTNLDRDKSTILEEKAQLMEKSISKLNELDKKCTEELNQAFDSALIEVEKDVDELKNIERSCVRQQEILKTALESGDMDAARLISRILTEKSNALQTTVRSKSIKHRNQPRLQFEKNPALFDLSSFGTISVMKHEIINEPVCTHTEMSSDEIIEQVNSSVKQAESTVSIPQLNESCFGSSPESFYIGEGHETRVCCIENIHVANQYILLLDSNNQSIKLLSMDCAVVESLRLPGKPLKICEIGQDEFAVSFSNVKRINRYKVDICQKSVSYEGGFNTNLYTTGLSWNGKSIVALMTDVDFSQKNNARDDIIELRILNPYGGTILQRTRGFTGCGANNSSLNLNNTQAILLMNNDLIVAEQNRISCFSLENDQRGLFAKQKRYFICGKNIPRNDIWSIAADDERIFIGTSSGRVLYLLKNDFSESNAMVIHTECIKSLQVDITRRRIIAGCEGDKIVVISMK